MNNEYVTFTIGKKKHIALIAHDNEKPKLIQWCKENYDILKEHSLYGTGLRQLPLHKTSCKIAGSRLNSGFFIAKTCQFFEKYLLYVLCGVVLYGIILV